MILTHQQRQRKVSAKIKKYVATLKVPHIQYYFIRGIFHINNIDSFNSAKGICEAATGEEFLHMTQSMCKLKEVNN